MPEFTLLQSIAAVLTLIAGGLIKGTIGFGLPLFVISLLSNIMPIELALAIMTLPIMASNLWLSLHGRLFMVTLKRFWPVIITAGCGIFIGAQIVVKADQSLLRFILGVVIIGMSLLEVFRPGKNTVIQNQPRLETPLGLIMGSLGGVLGGLSTIYGPPLIIFFNMLRLPKELFVAAIGVTFFFTSLFLVLAFGSVGILTQKTALLSFLAIPPVFIGLYVGLCLRKRIPQKTFQRIVLIFLLLLGVNLIRQSLF
ncbi:MAG: sulfite exporter TauE/SafE family protein [Desulfohalobiaceae bacterium]|nr:sulfite exporter TauE/SafE family protein [Desulfohalobiaceae bacterium]